MGTKMNGSELSLDDNDYAMLASDDPRVRANIFQKIEGLMGKPLSEDQKADLIDHGVKKCQEIRERAKRDRAREDQLVAEEEAAEDKKKLQEEQVEFAKQQREKIEEDRELDRAREEDEQLAEQEAEQKRL